MADNSESGWDEVRVYEDGGQSAVQMLLPVTPLAGLDLELPGASLVHGVSKLAALDGALMPGSEMWLPLEGSAPDLPAAIVGCGVTTAKSRMIKLVGGEHGALSR